MSRLPGLMNLTFSLHLVCSSAHGQTCKHDLRVGLWAVLYLFFEGRISGFHCILKEAV